MRKWFQVGLVVFLILAGIITGVFWFGFPQVQSFLPEDGSDSVATSTSIRLTFSRVMQPDSVLERLTIEPHIETNSQWEGKTLVIDPVFPWQPGTEVKVLLNAGARAAGVLSLPVQNEVSWSFTVRQPSLLFLYPATGASNIYWMDLKTLEQEMLTDHFAGVQDFSIDQERSQIYYSANNSSGGSDIYSLDLKTMASGDELLTPTLVLECLESHCRLPVSSPKGDFLAFERTEKLGFPRVWLLPLPVQQNQVEKDKLAGEAILADDPAHQTLLPAWSLDGLLAYYDTQTAAFLIYDPYSGDRVLFPNQTGQSGAWHPEGREFLAPEIFFLDTGSVSGLKNLANSHLIQFNRLTNSTLDLTPGDEMEDSSPAYSPDGEYLAFARKYLDPQRWTPGRQLWVMKPEIGQSQAITNDLNYNHYEFAWSPDSKQLAYVKFNQTILTAPPEIWLFKLINAEQTRLVENGYLPQWMP